MPALEAQTPTSQSAAPSASRSRAAYGAPEAPVIPRKTFISWDCALLLLRSLGSFQEDRQILEAFLPERREFRHRRARIHARRTFEMADLVVDAEVPRSDRRKVGSAEVR